MTTVELIQYYLQQEEEEADHLEEMLDFEEEVGEDSTDTRNDIRETLERVTQLLKLLELAEQQEQESEPEPM